MRWIRRGRHAVLAVVLALGTVIGAHARAQEAAETAAHEALTAYIEAIAAGDVEALEAILAPEFQILRANGAGYDRDGYLASDLPVVDPSFAWRVEDVVATTAGDLLVVRYQLAIEQTIGGEAVTLQAPRLTVFRQDGERWLVVAHANFAAPA